MLRLSARVFDTTRAAGCRLDAHREDDTLHLGIHLPGADPADVAVDVKDDTVTISAARRKSDERAIEEQIVLPDGLDTDRLDARFAEGVLTLQIPIRKQERAAGTPAS
ncbi:Hsp20/alpha crystallin family protein [Actinoplanes sp. NPDC049265]|uniref:Hsp20/alpha crystallin family protein n=1 Tax=Actinoplanes sp. NPDC049265 TaxID=3363902 RepID=UPI003717ED77